MTEGTHLQEVQEDPRVTKEVAEARRQVEQATFEPEAALEKGDVQQAEEVEEAFKEAVDAAVPAADRGPGTEDEESETRRPGDQETEREGESATEAIAPSAPPEGSPVTDPGETQSYSPEFAPQQQAAADQIQGQPETVEGAAAGLEATSELIMEKEEIQQYEEGSSKPDNADRSPDPSPSRDTLTDDTPTMVHSTVENIVGGMEEASQQNQAFNNVMAENASVLRAVGQVVETIKEDGNVGQREGEIDDSSEDVKNEAGKAAIGGTAVDPSRSYSGVEMTQGEVLEDSDWNENVDPEPLDGSEPENSIPAGEEISAGGAADLKENLAPFKNNLGQLREMVVEAAGDEGGTLLLDAAPLPENPTSSDVSNTIQNIADDVQTMSNIAASYHEMGSGITQNLRDGSDSGASADQESSETPDPEGTSQIAELESQAQKVKEEIRSLQGILNDMLPAVGQKITYTTFEKTGENSYHPVEVTTTVTADGLVEIIEELNQIYFSILNSIEEMTSPYNYVDSPSGSGANIGGTDQLWEPVDQTQSEQGMNTAKKEKPSLSQPENNQNESTESLARDQDSNN